MQNWQTTVQTLYQEITLTFMMQWTNKYVDDNCKSASNDHNCKSASSDHTNQTAKHTAHVVQILQHIYQILGWRKVLK